MDATLRHPSLVRQQGNMNIQKPSVTNGDNVFAAGSLVVITSAALIAVATDGVLCYGWSPDKSHLSTEYPPDAPFGQLHWPFSPADGAEFEINITNGAGTFGEAGSAPQRSAVTIGTSYGLLRMTSGDYSGMQFLASDETTATLLTVVGWVDGDQGDATVYNPRVRVKIIPAKIQG